MRHPSICGRLFLLGALFIVRQVQANDLYVATNGTSSGPGTMTQPYDLTTAFSGAVGQPGDTFWLTGGNYIIGHINTKIQGSPGAPITFRKVPGEQARVDGSLTLFDSTGYVVLRDLEFYSSDTNRVSSETNIVNLTPTDIPQFSGISSYSPNLEFINLVVHDEPREGIYLSEPASNNLIYGCVIYNNGWRSPNNAEGHGIYAEGTTGTQEIADNIVFSNAGDGLHIYSNESNDVISGITLIGNVAFNAGAIQDVRYYIDWIVGVDAPATSADDMVFENNMGYQLTSLSQSLAPATGDAAQIGREGVNGSVALLNNYLPNGLEMNNWTIAAVSGNFLSAPPGQYALTINQQPQLAAAWDDNTYMVPPGAGGFLANGKGYDFAGWQSGTGFDSNSTYIAASPTNTQVFVQTNYYEPGRANITVYNWDNLTNVAVNVNSVLSPGAPFEVRNAEDFLAPPVLSGVFTNQLLDLPMTNLTVAVPNGPMITPTTTGPTFNVFVLLPRSIRLQVKATNSQVQLLWPTNAGAWILQSTTNLTVSNSWLDVTNAPSVVGDDNVVTNDIFGNARFYRLCPSS